MRGKLDYEPVRVNEGGITPACAGKTSYNLVRVVIDKDHPRVCGENVLIYHGLFMFLGSPPRVRGKLSRKNTFTGIRRITPACAGKTMRHILHTIFSKDHPRVCGENCRKILVFRVAAGSPPRVRGKQLV